MKVLVELLEFQGFPGFVNTEIQEILFRALEGKELGHWQVEELLNARGAAFHALMSVADFLRSKQVGNDVSFVVNRNINFTNICTKNCRFCFYSVPPGDTKAFMLSVKDIQQKVREGLDKGITEVCIQGGIAPDVTLDTYLGILRAIKSVEGAESIHIHAFSPQEVKNASESSGENITSVLRTLKENGLDSMPGTAAEILVDDVRRQICPNKVSSDEWISIIKTAHREGIKTTSTILYGHIETGNDIYRHLQAIRGIQKDTGSITEFIPLSFISESKLERKLYRQSVDAMLDLKLYAVSRIVLGDVIKNIQASWVKLGERLCQLALSCGCNDVGGTLMEESISKEASGGRTKQQMSVDELLALIRTGGRSPVQRTTDYLVLRRFSEAG
ncbi:MAG: 7,8-didemethyl-8-hydroxy-5-deazariboflavin synthase subunit CofH [Candidatus Odinarchaeota archaeon]